MRIAVLADIHEFLNMHRPYFGPADYDLDAALEAYMEAEGCKPDLE